MHAAYNAQIAVSKGIILAYYVGQERTDFYAMVPTLDAFARGFGFYPRRLCADAGYGSFPNYRFLSTHRIVNFVKYQGWEQERSGNPSDLFSFDPAGNLICLKGKTATTFESYHGRHPKGKGYLFYLVEECAGCRCKRLCRAPLKVKDDPGRVFEINKDLFRYKLDARDNLLSVKGIEMRVNRSSQVEGAFGVIKQDMDYDRIRRRGLENVRAEFMLVCLGYVLRKLFSLIDGTAKLDYWKAPPDLQPESPPQINFKRIFKKKKRGKNETLRRNYKGN